jgi:hypothetical protein
LVEHFLAKEDVARSSRVTRSIFHGVSTLERIVKIVSLVW